MSVMSYVYLLIMIIFFGFHSDISLSRNNIGTDGAVSLAEALKSNKTLTILESA